MVKNDRVIGSLSGYVFLASVPFWVFMAWLQGSSHYLFAHSMMQLNLFVAALQLTVGVVLLRRARRWKGINERRQVAAIWGFAGRVPLALPQPVPNAGALPLPFTITLKPTPLKFLLIFCWTSAPSFAIELWLYFVGVHYIEGYLPFFVFLGLGAWGLLLLCFFHMFFPQRLEVTSQGLTVRHAVLSLLGTDWPYGKHIISWREAQLFAISDGKPGTPATHYELSSPLIVVRWGHIRHPRWWSLHLPAIPFAEYDAQMDALIALISGVTGLPLYDVR